MRCIYMCYATEYIYTFTCWLRQQVNSSKTILCTEKHSCDNHSYVYTTRKARKPWALARKALALPDAEVLLYMRDSPALFTKCTKTVICKHPPPPHPPRQKRQEERRVKNRDQHRTENKNTKRNNVTSKT